MSYLSQMAGLAVQNFVSAAVGHGRARGGRSAASRAARAATLGNFWRDLYRSLVYILLPLAIVVAVILISQGVPQTFHGHATATTLQGAHQTIARGPVASQIAIKQLGHERRRLLQLELRRPVREPDRALELRRDARDPADPGWRRCSCSGGWCCAPARLDGVRGDVRRLRDRRRDQPAGRAARLAGAAQLGREHHDGPRPVGRQHGRQGGPLRHRRRRPSGRSRRATPRTARSTAASTRRRRPAAPSRSSTCSSAR